MKKAAAVVLSFFASFAIAQTVATLPKLKEGEPLPNDLFVKLAKIVNPFVVNISTTYLPQQQRMDPRLRDPRFQDPFFQLFNQFMQPQQQKPVEALGSGFVIRPDGLIITNNHVIDKANIIKVQLAEKAELYDAKVIGRDSRTDVALIKIETKKQLPAAAFGSSNDLQVGEWVAAFGNPLGHGHSMTKGIVSAIGREIDEINLAPFIQTDASINPGNSGGPLVNTQGQVIGVNAAIDPRGQGIGFAIPIDYVKSILPELEKDGSVRRGYVGIQMGELNDDAAEQLGLKSTEGAFIIQVVPGSPAEKAGFREYDVIIEMDGQKVTSYRDVSKIIARSAIGKELSVKVTRNNKSTSIKVTIGEAPREERMASQQDKKYEGQKAPFDFGFRIAEYSMGLAQEFGIPPLRQPGPVVIDVDASSPAARSGLSAGDVILDVNKTRVSKAKDLLKNMKKDRNILRVLKRDRVVLLELRSV